MKSLAPRLTLTLALSACGAATHQTVPVAPAPQPASAPQPGTPAEPEETVVLEPVRIEVITRADGSTESITTDASSLFDQGTDALLDRRFSEAIAAYGKLVKDFPDSQLIPAALYNVAAALEGSGDYLGAIEAYRKVISRVPAASQDARDARFRMGALMAEVGHHGDAVRTWEGALAGDDLSPSERIEALTRLGYSLLEQKDETGAEEVLRQGLAYHAQVSATDQIDAFFVAMAQYTLAQIPHRQFRAAPLRYPEEQMIKDMEHKSSLYFLARDRYAKVVDYKNPYWITAAVYQMGMINKEFWDDIVSVPVPPQLDAEGRELYVNLLNENREVRKFLDGSLLFHEKNLEWAKQLSTDTEWVDGSRVRIEEIRQLMAKRQNGELFQPGRVPRTVDPGGRPPRPGGSSAKDQTTEEYVPGRVDL